MGYISMQKIGGCATFHIQDFGCPKIEFVDIHWCYLENKCSPTQAYIGISYGTLNQH